MTTCAVVQLLDFVVVNIIVADPTDPAPNECELIEIQPGISCDIGWIWNGTQFIPPTTGVIDDN